MAAAALFGVTGDTAFASYVLPALYLGLMALPGYLIMRQGRSHWIMPKTGQGPLDETIHAQARLSIVAFLAGLESSGFTALRDALGMTDGNLSTHLRKLEEAGYVATDKKFVDRKPHTSVRLTDTGRRAFSDYLRALEQLIGKTSPGES